MLGAIEVAAIAVLFLPIRTHAVLYEPGTPVPPGVLAWQAAASVAALAFLATLVAPIWLAYRIIWKHRTQH